MTSACQTVPDTGPDRDRDTRPAAADSEPDAALHAALLRWYADHARDLPWRADDATPWGVLVSEVMLQQTPVARVLDVWMRWLRRWPDPTSLAAAAPGEAVREWGRLGYPRRALRLHAAAGLIAERHGGEVPCDVRDLRALPGVGGYTAAAVAAFGFGHRHAVVDTNVRRVQARLVTGVAQPAPSLTAAETRLAADLLPPDPDSGPPVSPRWNVAVMELGALVCTARSPRCGHCPVQSRCRWHLRGRPADEGPPRRGQPWAGTDRQVRGRLMAVLRAAAGPVPAAQLDGTWDDAHQRRRCLDSLVADGLVEPLPNGWFALPGEAS